MELNIAANEVKKAVNTFKALKELEGVIDAAFKAETLTKELQAAADKARKDIYVAKEEVIAAQATIKETKDGNIASIAAARAEAEAIKSKASVSAAKIIDEANAKANAVVAAISDKNKSLSAINSEIVTVEKLLADKHLALAELNKLIESTKAQFKAIGG